jgi:hypothetical protein
MVAIFGIQSGFAQNGYGSTSVYDRIQEAPKDKHLFVIPPDSHWYEQPWSDSTYLLPKFEEGRIQLKNGYTPTRHLLMNYNMLFETIVIKQENGEITSLKYSNDIKYVWIGNNKFVYTQPHGYMHVLEEGKASVGEISFMNSAFNSGSWDKHGNPITDWRDGVSHSPRYYYIEKRYYIYPDSSLHLIRPSPAALPKIFKKEKSKIRAYEKAHKIDYKRREDILDIVSYCNREL